MTDLPLFAPLADDLTRDIERLTKLASELGPKAGHHGVTVSDLRIAAENAGILTGQESASRMKRLNLGAILLAADLYRTKRYRRSSVPRSHGNIHVVHVIREFAEVA